MKAQLSRLAGLCILVSALTRLPAAENPSPSEAEVRSGAVFYLPLVWVGDTPPTEQENQILAGDIKEIKAHGLGAGVPALEDFVATHTASPWTPSLQANLGRYYFDHGRYSDARQSWEPAWAATKAATNGPAKRVADFTFAYWTRLLAGVGQVNELRPLLEEAKDRTFDALAMRIMVNNTRQEYKLMVNSTDVGFRCGIYALNDVLRALKMPAADMAKIMHTPSPITGFSLKKLVELGGQQGLQLVAAQWGTNKMPVVPSVLHWKQNHYAAVTAERNGKYHVNDSVIGMAVWLTAQEIQAEASGYFVVPKDNLPADWTLLSETEAGEIYGRGRVTRAPDAPDGCGNGSGGGPPPGGNPAGGPGAPGLGGGPGSGLSCQSCNGSHSNGSGNGGTGGNSTSCCGSPSGSNGGDGGGAGAGGSLQFDYRIWAVDNNAGMPVWEVSEPCINVWLYDEPLGYQPGVGNRISFKMAYKQRDMETYANPRPISPNIFSLGPNWNCSWISYVKNDGNGTMLVPGGGVRQCPLDGTKEFYSDTTMTQTADSQGNANFVLAYANGAADYYQFVPSEKLDGCQVAFLSSKVDQYGHTTQFIYQDTNGVSTLQYVVDPDGRTNTLHYDGSDPSLITGVQDPFGHTAAIQYDSTGMLTNITDVAGMSSSFQYDLGTNSEEWITNLTTPYGATTFLNATTGDDWDGPMADGRWLVRAVTVVDTLGGTNIYMLRQESDYVYTNASAPYIPFLMGPYSTNEIEDDAAVPVTPPTPLQVDCGSLYFRDSFHWGPRQATALPSDLTTFAPSDFIKARMRHWLHDHATYDLGQTLEMEQAPSPDGVACGQSTWYVSDGQQGADEGYDPQLAQIARVLPDGTTWYVWYQRDDWGRATNVVETYSSSYGAEPQTRTNIYIYDANEVNLVQHIGPLGETTSYGYDGNNQLLFVTNALNEVTSYIYDGQGRLTSVTTPAGLTTENTYYNSGPGLNFVQTVVDQQIKRTNSYTYANDLVATHTDERGLTTTDTWDALNRLRRVDYPDGSFVTNSYNRLDLVQVRDRLGFTTSYGYDSLRRMTAVTNALGNCTFYNYCPCGGLESIQDAAGNFTSFTYDNAGDRLSTIYPEGYVVNNTYDLLGRVVSTVDSGGIATTNWYNNQGLRYAISNAVGQVSLLAYDVEDHVTNSVDANGVSVNSAYDLLGRVLARSYPDGGVESYGYTYGVSAPTSYTNQIGEVTGYAYDPAGRKLAETNALKYVTWFTNSPAGDLMSLTDGNRNTTKWGYNVYGRVTNKVDAANNVLFLYKYDPDNRLTNRWSAAKGNTAYAYDGVGNLIRVAYPVSPAIALQYDVLNRLVNMVDAVGTTVYAYDNAGQLLSEGGLWPGDTVNLSYQNRLRTGLSVESPNGPAWTQSYGYDAARRLTGITSSAGAFGYIYDPVALQRVDELTLPNGAYITNTFDNVARLTGTWLINSQGSNLDSYVYAYNQAGQRTQVARAAGEYVNYTYDNIGELSSATGMEPSGQVRLEDRLFYAYDAAGNLLQKKANNNLVSQTAYGLNQLNEITNSWLGNYVSGSGWNANVVVSGSSTSPATNVTVNGSSAWLYGDNTFALSETLVAGSNGFTAIAKDVYGRRSTNVSSINVVRTNNAFAYDLNGNLLTDGTRCFAYDDENQLISVWKTNGWRNDFVYDGKMRRRIERDYTWAGSSGWQLTNEIHFVYDGNLVVQERDGSNQTHDTYTRGNDLSGKLQGAGGIGGLLARTDRAEAVPWSGTSGGGIPPFGYHSYYHADGNGNVTMLISASQMIVAKYLYDPFGNTLAKSGLLADVNNYRFSSKEWCDNARLYYYLYRFYEPNLQRWLNRDSIGDKGSLVFALRNTQLQKNGFPTYKQAIDVSVDAVAVVNANLYEVVADDPISNVDSFGLWPWSKPKPKPPTPPAPTQCSPDVQNCQNLGNTPPENRGEGNGNWVANCYQCAIYLCKGALHPSKCAENGAKQCDKGDIPSLWNPLQPPQKGPGKPTR